MASFKLVGFQDFILQKLFNSLVEKFDEIKPVEDKSITPCVLEQDIYYFASEEWWTGNKPSFINQTPATYFIQSSEDTEVLLISNKNISKDEILL